MYYSAARLYVIVLLILSEITPICSMQSPYGEEVPSS